MLYDNRLDVFLACARAGSFSKAGEELNMTSTGVLRLITQLEYDLDIQLFVRSHRGLRLTDAGQQLLKEAQELQKICAGMMERILAARDGLNQEIRIGTSPLTPPALLSDLWPKIQPMIPDLSFRLIPFENTPQNASRILNDFGNEIDLVVGFFDDQFLGNRTCAGYSVGECALGIGIPFGHPLWGRKSLKPEDLYDQKVLIIQQGWSRATDQLRDWMNSTGRIEVEDLSFFSSDALLQAINQQELMVCFDIWNGINPLLDIVRTPWAGTIEYGFLCSPHPSGAIRRFLDAVSETVNELS